MNDNSVSGRAGIAARPAVCMRDEISLGTGLHIGNFRSQILNCRFCSAHARTLRSQTPDEANRSEIYNRKFAMISPSRRQPGSQSWREVRCEDALLRQTNIIRHTIKGHGLLL